MALAFISACMAHGYGLYRMFYPTSTSFWVINSYFYWLSATCIHGIGAVLNISFLWLEIAVFQELRIITNLRRTRYILIIIISSLYVWWLVLCVILANYILAQLVLAFYMFFMIGSVGTGAWKLSKVLASNTTALAFSRSETSRNQAKNAEVRRIATNAKSICVFGAVYFWIQVVYLVTFHFRFQWLSFWLGVSMEGCCFCIGCTVLWHLKGLYFLSWDFRKLQTKKRTNPASQGQQHIIEGSHTFSHQIEFNSFPTQERLHKIVKIEPLQINNSSLEIFCYECKQNST